ncbi:MAG TPA: hypothetical protein VM008_09420 [Phycisphaerae bacterium]|nr:hypothetical protein [Phycisphaerae bacterium]
MFAGVVRSRLKAVLRRGGATGSGSIAVTLGEGNAFTFDIKSILPVVGLGGVWDGVNEGVM